MKKVDKLNELLEDVEKVNESKKITNLDIINQFVNNSFNQEKDSVVKGNLKIVRMPEGWVLMDYGTPVCYRNTKLGELYLNNNKYSITTSKVRGQVRNSIVEAGITYNDVSEQDLLGKMYKG